jgi:hypothetical protein
MCRITDDGLIKVPNLDCNAAVNRPNRAEISDMAIAADPHRRPFGQGAGLLFFEPLVEFDGAAADIGMRRASHFQALLLLQDRYAVGRSE